MRQRFRAPSLGSALVPSAPPTYTRPWTGTVRLLMSGSRNSGRTINLYDLERKILIPEFLEPRIHFAIVCASASCPKLQSIAYSERQLEAQLEESARGFINDRTKNRFDQERKIAHLSMIFKWFEDDFVTHSGSLIHYVKRYVAEPELARDLETTPYSVQFLEYDWRLNGPPPGEERYAGVP